LVKKIEKNKKPEKQLKNLKEKNIVIERSRTCDLLTEPHAGESCVRNQINHYDILNAICRKPVEPGYPRSRTLALAYAARNTSETIVRL
jgi:hypothetical protein